MNKRCNCSVKDNITTSSSTDRPWDRWDSNNSNSLCTGSNKIFKIKLIVMHRVPSTETFPRPSRLNIPSHCSNNNNSNNQRFLSSVVSTSKCFCSLASISRLATAQAAIQIQGVTQQWWDLHRHLCPLRCNWVKWDAFEIRILTAITTTILSFTNLTTTMSNMMIPTKRRMMF